jgi:hypothetical protein
MNPYLQLPLVGGVGLVLLFAALWLWQQRHRDAGIVDEGDWLMTFRLWTDF